MSEPTAKVLDALVRSGMLLQQDKDLPSVVTLVTGESLGASWWGHPKGRVIFKVLSELSHHPDVLFTKLLHRKVTLVHRKLWPALLAAASADEPWQVSGLSTPARKLLTEARDSSAPVRGSGKAVKEIELRLLAHAEEVHTESGRHETALEPWSTWSRRMGVKPMASPVLGCREIEKAVKAMGAPASALPWPSESTASTHP
jgi:hypothetical protein